MCVANNLLCVLQILDWSYYVERLGGCIQKIITIPAALQSVSLFVSIVWLVLWGVVRGFFFFDGVACLLLVLSVVLFSGSLLFSNGTSMPCANLFAV